MRLITRRSMLRSSAGLIAAGSVARPYIGNAAATTATAWWTQGFIQSEDTSFKKLAADYEKASGNKLDYSILPFVQLRQSGIGGNQRRRSGRFGGPRLFLWCVACLGRQAPRRDRRCRDSEGGIFG